jgi:hypothetical protein
MTAFACPTPTAPNCPIGRPRLEAIRRVGAVLKDDAQSIAVGEDWRIEVTDGTGLILFQLTFLMIESPVMRRADHRRS